MPEQKLDRDGLLDRYPLRAALERIRDPRLSEDLINLFAEAHAQVASNTVDTCILAARRLPCLYLAMLRAGLPEFSCDVLSDRCLEIETDPAFWQGRRILILDDSVILGSTLAFLVSRTRKLVGSTGTVQVRAVCIDAEQSSPALVEFAEVQAPHRLPSQQVREFSVDLARTLFHNLVPYFSDFLVSRRISVSASAATSLLESERWHTADVTSRVVASDDQASYTLVPTRMVEDAIAVRLGPELMSSVAVLKVRTFIQIHGFDATLVLVPIALLKPSSIEDVDRLLRKVAIALRQRGRAGTHWETWEPEARQRLLQLFVSIAVLQEIWTDLSALDLVDPRLSESDIEPAMVEVNFGRHLAEAMRKAFTLASEHLAESRTTPASHDAVQVDHPVVHSSVMDDEGFAQKLGRVQQLTSLFGMPPHPSATEVTAPGESFVHPIASVFGYIDQHLEGPERTHIRDLPAKTFLKTFRSPRERRLNHGLMLTELLRHIVSPADPLDPSWNASAVSLALDICNDIGIAVPCTRYSEANGTVYRQYRIGENSFLAVLPSTSLLGEEPTKGRVPSHTLLARTWLRDPHWLVSRFLSTCTSLRDIPEHSVDLTQAQRRKIGRLFAEEALAGHSGG